MNFECILSVFFNLQKSTLNAICGVPEHLAILLFAFDAWSWRYLSWPDTLLEVIAFLRCLILMLFVVAGGTFESHCLPSMLDFDAICGVPEHLAILLFAFDAWLWRYLSWPEALLEVIGCSMPAMSWSNCGGHLRLHLAFAAFLL